MKYRDRMADISIEASWTVSTAQTHQLALARWRLNVGALGETQTGPRPRLSSPVLARGETLSAFAGVAFFGVVALVLAASGWWTFAAGHEARQEDNARRVEAVGTLLATSAEALLDKNEVSLLRGLVKDTARRERLTECRVRPCPTGRLLRILISRSYRQRRVPKRGNRF